MDMYVSIADIHKRLNYLPESAIHNVRYTKFEKLYEKCLNQPNTNEIMYCIENWTKLPGSTNEVKMAQVIELFDVLSESASNAGPIRKMGEYICNEAVTRVRDASETQYLIKRKLSMSKTKATSKIKKKLEDAFNAINGAANNTVTAAFQSANAPTSYQSKEDQKEQATAEAYINMYNTASKCIHADRILENYNKMSKRYNIDKVIADGAGDVESLVYELCRLVDTYNMPNTVKFNTVLETAYYGLNKSGLEYYSMNDVVEAACNYFSIKENGGFDCKAILSAAVVVKPEDQDKVKYITELDPEKRKASDDCEADECGEGAKTEPEPLNLCDIKNESANALELYAEAEVNKMPEKAFNHINISAIGQGSHVDVSSNDKDIMSVPNADSMDSIMKLDIEVFNKKKHEEVLKAQQLTEAYEDLVNGELNKVATSPYSAISYLGIQAKAQNLLKITGGLVKDRNDLNILKGTFVEIPNDPNRVKAIIQARLKYCNLMCSCFKGMLETNYKLLGFSEADAARLSEELGKGNTEAIADVKKAFIERPETYETKFGYDFRKFGGGVVYVAKADLGLFGQYYSPARIIQMAFEHDCIILAHGLGGNEDEKKKLYYQQKASIPASNKLTEIMVKSLKAALVSLKQGDMQKAYEIVYKLKESTSKYGAVVSPTTFGIYSNEYKSLQTKENIKISIAAIEKYLRTNEGLKYKSGGSLFPQKDKNGKIWMIQPVATEDGALFNTVNDLINYVAIKEKKKDILVLSCNPDHVEISKPNIKIPGVKITYAMNTVIADSNDISTEDDIALVENELDLIKFANENNVDYFNDDYLTECMEFCFNSDIEVLIEESFASKAWNTLVMIISKVIGAIIGFFKKIFELAGHLFALIKQKITGHKDDKTDLKKPVKATFAEVNGNSAKATERNYEAPKDLADAANKANSGIYKAFNAFKNAMNTGNKQLDNFIRKQAKDQGGNPSVQHSSTMLGQSYNMQSFDEGIKDLTNKIKSQISPTSNELTISNSKRKLEEVDINKIVNDFKLSNAPDKEHKLKGLIEKLYTKSPESIIKETPSLLNWIRQIFVIGSFAINPILGAIVFIGDCVVKYNYRIDDAKKMLDAIDNEIGKAKKQQAKVSKEDKDRLTQYIESLNKAYKKIDTYYEDMLSDSLLDKKYEEDKNRNNHKSSDYDMDDDDFDFDIDMGDFGESVSSLADTIEGISAMNEKSMINMIMPNLTSYPYEMIDCITEFSILYPEVLSPSDLASIMEIAVKDVRAGKHHNSNRPERYTFINIYQDAVQNLYRSTDAPKVNKDPMTISEALDYTQDIAKMYSLIDEMNFIYNNYSPMLEISFTNQVKMATEKVKKFFTKMSDKEKDISKNIDVSTSNLAKAAERSLTNDNREAIIKGTILPSASKCLKLALTSGILVLLHQPVLAVISILGYLGTSKKYKAKERQMILDEIEIELQMTEKYIQIADEKNDMKAMKQLLTIRRDLERQRQRIKYKMKVQFGQTVYDTKNTPDAGMMYGDK